MNYQQYRPSGFSFLPEVVKNLLIINGIFFLATVIFESKGIDLSYFLGLHYFGSEEFKIWQFITYMFMHGSFTHLFFNMFAVWMFGAAIENIWGPKRFLTYYIITGLGAALCHYAIVYVEMQPTIEYINNYVKYPSLEKLNDLSSSGILNKYGTQALIDHYNEFSEEFNALYKSDPKEAIRMSVGYMEMFRADILNAPVVVGASGAVFGLLLAYGMIFPNSIIYIYFAIPIKAKYFVILYGLIELFSGVANVKGDEVAHFAHLGGLVTGLLLILLWRNRNRRNHNPFE
ncbi:MAG: rhomboid family intramembrane serine protease [Bacteroidota bacterium]